MNDDRKDAAGDAYDLDELLGAYALDAVDPAERRRVEDYLAVNPRAAAEVQDHREVATMLAFTGMDAPDGVWERIADEIGENAPPPGPELAEVLSIGDPPRRRRRWSAAAAPWVAAAAAVVAVVAVAVVAVARRSEAPADPLEVAVEAARADRDSLSTVLTSDLDEATADAVIDQDGHGYVVARDLPTLPDGQTYQLWGVVENGDVISLGIFGPNPEIESFTVEGDVSALAITIEQSPGVISDGNPVGAFVGSF